MLTHSLKIFPNKIFFMKSDLVTKLSCGKSLSDCPELASNELVSHEEPPIFKRSSSASFNFMKSNKCKKKSHFFKKKNS